jgi:branched-chain amino acid transport system permease protein
MAVTVETSRDPRRATVDRELRLCRTRSQRVGLTLLLTGVVAVPLNVGSPFLSTLITLVAIGTVGAVGLNLSMGYAGQISLGHGFFLAVGAYAAAKVGGDWGMPLPVWLIAAAVASGLAGMVVGLFALRLRGTYLAIVSLGLVFFGIYLFNNWTSLSGGVNGRSFDLPVSLGPVDFGALAIGSQVYSREQSLGVLYWIVAALCLLLAHNIVRSGFGRAMLAVREQDIAAEVLGVRPFRTKVAALAAGSAMGGVAGALLANELRYALPSGFDLNMSIQYVAMIVIGGMGTTYGPLLGAAFVTAFPQLINRYADQIPFVKSTTSSGFGITKDNAGLLVYAVLIIVTLLVAPGGLSGLGARLRHPLHRVTSRRRDRTAKVASE